MYFSYVFNNTCTLSICDVGSWVSDEQNGTCVEKALQALRADLLLTLFLLSTNCLLDNFIHQHIDIHFRY